MSERYQINIDGAQMSSRRADSLAAIKQQIADDLKAADWSKIPAEVSVWCERTGESAYHMPCFAR